jgi:hypothetical protein
LKEELEEALAEIPIVREVRGHGFPPRSRIRRPARGGAFLPPELRAAGRVDEVALETASFCSPPSPRGMAMRATRRSSRRRSPRLRRNSPRWSPASPASSAGSGATSRAGSSPLP